jgi:hypothetical protein
MATVTKPLGVRHGFFNPETLIPVENTIQLAGQNIGDATCGCEHRGLSQTPL